MRCLDFKACDLPTLKDIETKGWDGLDDQFSYYLDRSYCVPRKVTIDGKLVAVGAIVFYEKSAWLGHILVASNFRRRGIGTLITNDLIKLSEARGIDSINLLASELGFLLYQRLEFSISGQHRVVTDCKATQFTNESAIRRMEPGDLPAVLAMDYRATGEVRTPVWRACSEAGWVYAPSPGIVRGVFQADFGHGLVIAEDEQAGISLLRFKHQQARGQAAMPSACHAALKFLAGIGTESSERQLRMTRGPRVESLPPMIYSRAAGFLG